MMISNLVSLIAKARGAFTDYLHWRALLELFNLLINPRDSDFDLTWHRDAIPAETPEEEEKEKLTIPHYGTQWNT